jgi:ADP-heptose:LPS heptosyltransferase
VNSFLIVRLGSLGDVVHGIPVAAALRQEFPNARVDWMVDPRYIELLNLVKGIDRRIGVDPRAIKHGAGRRRFRETLRELREADYDAVIDLQGLLKSAMLARSVHGRRTIGFPRRHLREKLARLFYTEAPDPGDATHVIYKNLALLTPLKVVDRRLRFPLDIPLHAHGHAGRRSLRADDYVVINPGRLANKQWPPERFGAVAAALRAISNGVRWCCGAWRTGDCASRCRRIRGRGGVSPPTTITISSGLPRRAADDFRRYGSSPHRGRRRHAYRGAGDASRAQRPVDLHDVTISRVQQCSCVYQRTQEGRAVHRRHQRRRGDDAVHGGRPRVGERSRGGWREASDAGVGRRHRDADSGPANMDRLANRPRDRRRG